MSRKITPSSAEAGVVPPPGYDDVSDDGAGLVKSTAEALGSFFANFARLSIGGVEAWTDRKAERRSARIRSRAASDRRQRLPGQGESASRT